MQEWLVPANLATTRIYDHRKTLPEDTLTFEVAYWVRPAVCNVTVEAKRWLCAHSDPLLAHRKLSHF